MHIIIRRYTSTVLNPFTSTTQCHVCLCACLCDGGGDCRLNQCVKLSICSRGVSSRRPVAKGWLVIFIKGQDCDVYSLLQYDILLHGTPPINPGIVGELVSMHSGHDWSLLYKLQSSERVQWLQGPYSCSELEHSMFKCRATWRANFLQDPTGGV